MGPSEKDLKMARDLLDKVTRETDPVKRAKLEALAKSYWHPDESEPVLTVGFELPPKDDGDVGT